MSGAPILVVDDDPDMRDLVRELLERAGHGVRAAAHGREALRLLYDVRPRLVVLDVAMPELDGWETLERIRDVTDVPVLMLTARDGRAREGARPARRRRRLRDQAVRPPGARWPGSRRCCAAAGAGRTEREAYDDGLVAIDFAAARGDRGRHARSRSRRSSSGCSPRSSATRTRCSRRDQLLELVWGDARAARARPGEALRRLPAPQARARRPDARRRSRPCAASATATARRAERPRGRE